MFGALFLGSILIQSDIVVLERGKNGYWAVEDTTLESEFPEAANGGLEILRGGPGRTILIQFHDLDRYCQGRQIQSAQLRMTINHVDGEPKLLAVRKLNQPWFDGPLRVAGKGEPSGRWAATWRHRRSGLNPISWQLAGARGSLDAEKIAPATATTNQGELLVSGLGQSMERFRTQPYDNAGFAIEFVNSVDFWSSEAAKFRPRLELTLGQRPPKMSGPDLAIELIKRSPTYSRIQVKTEEVNGRKVPEDIGEPTYKTWPHDGDKVTYTAIITNRGDTDSKPAELRWQLRERETKSIPIPPIASGKSLELSADLTFKLDLFDHRRQAISARIVEANDASPVNDFLEIQENGLMLGVDAKSSADKEKAQYLVWLWNEVYGRHSRYAIAPEGSKERVFIQAFGDAETLKQDQNLDGFAVLSSGTDQEADFLKQIGRALGLVDIQVPSAGLIDPFGGLFGGDTRQDTNFPAMYSYPFDPGPDVGLDAFAFPPRRMLSAVDVGALNGRIGRRRGYSGEYLMDTSLNTAVQLRDFQGRPLQKAKVTLTPLINGVLAGERATTYTTSETGSFVLPNITVPKRAQTLTGSQLRDNPFGVVDVAGAFPAYRVEVKVHGVTETSWVKLWHLVQSFYRGSKAAAFLVLPVNVPGKAIDSVNVAEPGNPPTDGNLDNSQPIPTEGQEVGLTRSVEVVEIRIRTKSLGTQCLIQTLDDKGKPTPFVKDTFAEWTVKGRLVDGWVIYRGLSPRAKSIVIKCLDGVGELSEVQVFGARG